MKLLEKVRWSAILLLLMLVAGCDMETGETTTKTGTTQEVTGSGEVTMVTATQTPDI